MATLTAEDYVIFCEMKETDSDASAMVKLIMWSNYVARQRYAAGQTRPHWKVYARTNAQDARRLMVRQVESHAALGYRMTVEPVAIEMTEDAAEKFAAGEVSYPLRGAINAVVNKTRVMFSSARKG